MANNKQSTKAKSKSTAVKSAAKSSTKSAAAKTKALTKSTKKTAKTNKSTVKSTQATKSKITIKTNSRKRFSAASKLTSFKMVNAVSINTLRSIHMITVGLLALLALLAGYLMNSTSYRITAGFITKDEINSISHTVFAPAAQPIYEVEIRWLIVIIMIVSLILPLLYLTKLRVLYEKYLNKTRMMPLRWIDYAVSGALIVEVTALINGNNDIFTLKLLAGAVMASAISAVIAERQNDSSRQIVRSAYFASLLSGLLPILFILGYLVTSFIFSTSQLPWYSIALFGVVLFQYIGWMRVLRMHLRGGLSLFIERNYLAVSLLTKAAFAIILIASFLRPL